MKKNKLKKITTLTCLAIFLFALLAPVNQVSAQTNYLKISTDKTSLEVGGTVKITIEVVGTISRPGEMKGKVIQITQTQSSNNAVVPTSCQMPQTSPYSCSKELTYFAAGGF